MSKTDVNGTLLKKNMDKYSVQTIVVRTHPLVELCVHGHNKNDGSVWAAQWGQ